jgi:iron complex outermembrane receptor protein
MQSPTRAQQAEEKATVITPAPTPAEGQTTETPAPTPAAKEKPTVIAPTPKWWESNVNQNQETPAPTPAAKEKAEVLEKIVVTATRTERNPDDVPASITIITKKDIEKQNIQTVDEALAQVVDTFDFRQRGWQDSQPSVNLRGFPADNQKRTLILLDGQNIATAYYNGVVWNSIPVQNIERIEVIRGPFSALYGGNAMGGVINIITTTPKKLEMISQTSYGTYNSWNSYLGAGDRLWDKVSIQGGFNYRNTNGYPTNLVTDAPLGFPAFPPSPTVVGYRSTVTPQGAPTYVIGDTGNNFWNDYSINGKISLDLAEGHKWTFSTLCSYQNYGYNNYHSYLSNPANGSIVVNGAPAFFPQVGLGNTNNSLYLLENMFLMDYGRTRTQVYSLTTDDSLTDTMKLKCHFGLVNVPESWFVLPGFPNYTAQTTYLGGPGSLYTTPSQNWVADVQVERPIGQKQNLTGGITYNTGWASTSTDNMDNWRARDAVGSPEFMSAGHDRNIGVYLQDEIAWNPKFNTVAGLRLDWWQTYGGHLLELAGMPIDYLPSRSYTQLSPKIAFLYRPLDWMTWRTSVGTAFRPPNVYELYTTWSWYGVLFQGNPQLKPEKTLSWEIGPTLKPFKGTTFTTTYFENYVTDFINSTSLPSGNWIQLNVPKVTMRGVEIELKQKLWSWLELFGNTTLLDARIREFDDDLAAVGKKITMTPRQQMNIGVTATYWDIKANISGRYVSKIMSTAENSDTVNNVYGSYDPFFVLNSKITYSPVKWVDLSVAWDNLLNRQYYEYYRTPGRTWWAQLTLKY